MFNLFLNSLFVLASVAHVQVTVAQTVEVNCTSEELADIQQRTVMTCSANDVFQLEWIKTAKDATDSTGGVLIYELSGGTPTPGGTINASRYEFVGSGDFPLAIKSVEVDDEGRYWCKILTVAANSGENSAPLEVQVPPGLAGSVSFSGEDWNIPIGGSATVEAGSTKSVNITMRGVKPEVTTITWSVSESTVIISNEVITSQPNVADNRLFDSTGTADITFPASPLTCTLTCTTPNRQTGDSSGVVQFNITLEVVKESTTPATSPESTATTDSTTDPITGQTTLESSTAILTTESTTDITTDGPGATDESGTGGLSGGAIAGIAVGAVVGGLLVLGLLGGLYHWYSRRPPSVVKPAPANGSHGQENGGQNADSAGKVKEKDG